MCQSVRHYFTHTILNMFLFFQKFQSGLSGESWGFGLPHRSLVPIQKSRKILSKILRPRRRTGGCLTYLQAHIYTSDSSWPVSWVSYYAVSLWLLQVALLLRVLWRYSAATACTVASQPFVTVESEYPHTLNGTATCVSTALLCNMRPT